MTKFSLHPVDARRIMLRQALHDVTIASACEDIAQYYIERLRDQGMTANEAEQLARFSNEIGRIAHEASRRATIDTSGALHTPKERL